MASWRWQAYAYFNRGINAQHRRDYAAALQDYNEVAPRCLACGGPLWTPRAPACKCARMRVLPLHPCTCAPCAQAIERIPGNAAFYYNRGMCARALGLFPLAAADIEAAAPPAALGCALECMSVVHT